MLAQAYGRCWARPSYNSVDAPGRYLSNLAARDSHTEEALKISAYTFLPLGNPRGESPRVYIATVAQRVVPGGERECPKDFRSQPSGGQYACLCPVL